MDTPSASDIVDLVQRGDGLPYRARIVGTVTDPEAEPFLRAAVKGDPRITLEPGDVRIERHGRQLRISQGNTEIIRRSSGGCWVFYGDGDQHKPVHCAAGRFEGSGLAMMLVESYEETSTLYPWIFLDYSEIAPGQIGDRPTWVVGLGENRSLHIDRETGITLAAADSREHVELRDLELLTEVPDPSWLGESVEMSDPLDTLRVIPDPPDPASVPGYLKELPPQEKSVAGRRMMRVWCDQVSLAGRLPDYEVGQKIQLPLGFRLPEASRHHTLPELLTIRRGHITPHMTAPYLVDGGAVWTALFRGDGWAAEMQSHKPFTGERELEGYFFHSPHQDRSYVTSMRITGIYIRIGYDGYARSQDVLWQKVASVSDCYLDLDGWMPRDLILDVELDDVDTPLKPQLFTEAQAVAEGDRLWILDRECPVARSFSLEDGSYLSQVLIPVPAKNHGVGLRKYSSRVVAHSEQHGDFLLSGTGGGTGINAGIATPVPMDEESTPPAGKEWAPEFPGGWDSTDSTDLIVVTRDVTVTVADRESGQDLASITHTKGTSPSVLIASPERIVTCARHHADIKEVHRWSPGTGWVDITPHGAPDELW